jgi:hypothetical protein
MDLIKFCSFLNKKENFQIDYFPKPTNGRIFHYQPNRNTSSNLLIVK